MSNNMLTVVASKLDNDTFTNSPSMRVCSLFLSSLGLTTGNCASSNFRFPCRPNPLSRWWINRLRKWLWKGASHQHTHTLQWQMGPNARTICYYSLSVTIVFYATNDRGSNLKADAFSLTCQCARFPPKMPHDSFFPPQSLMLFCLFLEQLH